MCDDGVIHEVSLCLRNGHPLPLHLAVGLLDIQAAWNGCRCGDAMVSVLTGVDRKLAGLSLVACARTVFPPREQCHEPHVVFDLIESWCAGRVSLSRVEEAGGKLTGWGSHKAIRIGRATLHSVWSIASPVTSQAAEHATKAMSNLANIDLRRGETLAWSNRQERFASIVRQIVPEAPSLDKLIAGCNTEIFG